MNLSKHARLVIIQHLQYTHEYQHNNNNYVLSIDIKTGPSIIIVFIEDKRMSQIMSGLSIHDTN